MNKKKPHQKGDDFEDAVCRLLKEVLPRMGYQITFGPKRQPKGAFQLGKDIKCGWVNKDNQPYLWHFECKSHTTGQAISKKEVADKLLDVLKSKESPDCYCLTASHIEFDAWVDETVAFLNSQPFVSCFVSFLTPQCNNIRHLFECVPHAFKLAYGECPPTLTEEEVLRRLRLFRTMIEDITSRGRLKRQLCQKQWASADELSFSTQTSKATARPPRSAVTEITNNAHLSPIKALLEQDKPRSALELITIVEDSDLTKWSTDDLAQLRAFKAKSLLELGEEQQAADSYKESAAITSDRSSHARRLMLHHLLNGRPDQACELARSVSNDLPVTNDFAVIAAEAIYRHEGAEAALSFLRSHPFDTLEWKCLEAAYMCINGDPDKAKELKNSNPTNITVLSSLAFSLFESIKPRLQSVPSSSLCTDQELIMVASDCMETLDILITLLDTTQLVSAKAVFSIQRAVMCIWFGQYGKAKEDCTLVLSETPQSVPALYNRTVAEIHLKEYVQAAEDAEAYISISNDIQGGLPLLCRTHMLMGNPVKVLEEVAKYSTEILDGQPDVKLLLLRCHLLIGDELKAKTCAEEIESEFSQDALGMGRLAATLGEFDWNQEARRLFRKALQCAPELLAPCIRLLNAEFEADKGNLDDAIALLRDSVEMPNQKLHDSALLRRLLYFLNGFARQRREAIPELLGLCRRFREEIGFRSDIAVLEASILESLGHLDEALAIYGRVSQTEANRPDVLARICVCQFRKGDEEKAIELARKAGESLKDPRGLMALAQVFHLAGLSNEAIIVAYRSLLLGNDDPEIYLAYIHMILSAPNVAEDVRDIANIGESSVVRLINEGTQEYAFAPGEERLLGVPCLPPDHKLAKAVFAHRPGDTISLSEREEDEAVTCLIQSAVSKYAKACSVCLERFRILFPDTIGVRKFVMKEDGDLTTILNEIRKQSENTDRIIEYIRSRQLPVSMLARMRGSDIVDAYGYMVGTEEVLHCSENTVHEQKMAEHLLSRRPTVAAEPVAILSALTLGLENEIWQAFERVIVPQSFLDELAIRDGRLASQEDSGFMTVFHEEGTFYRHMVTPDSVKEQREFVKRITDFVTNNCQVTGRPAKNNSLDQVLDNAVLKSTQEAIALAAETDGLLSDELALRMLAKEHLSVDSICTHQVIWHLHTKDMLSGDTFHKKIILLVRLGYQRVHFDDSTLWKSMEMHAFQPNDDRNALLANLRLPHLSSRNLIGMTVSIAANLWGTNLPESYRRENLFSLLDALATHIDKRRLVGGVKQYLRDRYELVVPTYLANVSAALDSWYNIHFIL